VGVRTEIKEYIVNLAEYTRDDPRVNIGVSPRGVQKLFEAARARAVLQGREYVTPDDIKRLASPLYGHRLVLTTDASIRDVDPSEIIAEALNAVPVPGMDHQ
jgi:MoxR-like ATPase